MDFLADFKPTSTQTISVHPPGGTGTSHPPHHTAQLPLPTPTFVSTSCPFNLDIRLDSDETVGHRDAALPRG
jgi:hypothetical protein